MTNLPRLGCAGVIKKDDKILLGLRGKKDAGQGKWVLPGGGVDPFERLEDALRREIREELGIEIDVEGQVGTYQIIAPPEMHKVIVYYWATYKSGDLTAKDDTLDARFFSRDEIYEIVKAGQTTETITKVLRDIGWYTE